MRIIAVINQKGGVGKTTTAQALAYGLIRKGKRVLAIDLDPQGNLTYSTGAEVGEYTAFDLLQGEAIAPLSIGKLDLVPASPFISVISKEGNIDPYNLKRGISLSEKEYDYIIIDTPPALSETTICALTASDNIIITAQADVYSLQGIEQLMQTINAVRENTKNPIKIGGILLTRYSKRAVISRHLTAMLEQTASAIGTKVYKTKIRENTAIKEAQAMRVSIFDYAPKSNGAKDYAEFVKEFMKGDEK